MASFGKDALLFRTSLRRIPLVHLSVRSAVGPCGGAIKPVLLCLPWQELCSKPFIHWPSSTCCSMLGVAAACIMRTGPVRPTTPWTLAVRCRKTPSTVALTTTAVKARRKGPLAARECPWTVAECKVALSRCPVQAVRARRLRWRLRSVYRPCRLLSTHGRRGTWFPYANRPRSSVAVSGRTCSSRCFSFDSWLQRALL